MTRRHVLAFDCFGTVFDSSNISDEDVRNYIEQTRRAEWRPLLPPQSFYQMPAHADAAAGIEKLRENYFVVTCSNLPMNLLEYVSSEAGIGWDAIVPIEASQSYKPALEAYLAVCVVLQVYPSDVTVVTAHANGPDVLGAPRAGMKCQIIRQPNYPKDILELARVL